MNKRRKQKQRRAQFECPVLTVTEAARRLRVSDQHIIGLIEGGELEAINVASSHTPRAHWRIPKEAFAAYKKKRSNIKTEAGR